MTILTQAYTSDAIFEAELKRVFFDQFFVSTSLSLSKPQSYYSFTLGNKALTCRNTQGGVKAFHNVCLHRCCLIDPLGKGQRRFQCGYHGWQYDDEGKLAKTPHFDKAEVKQQSLTEVPLLFKKGLVFAQVNGAQHDELFASEVEALCDALSLSFEQAPFHVEELTHHCNWKLLVENVLDREHLSFVHAASFAKMEVKTEMPAVGKGGVWTLQSRVQPRSSKLDVMLKHFKGTAHHYLHGYVFPNLFLANTNNLIGFVNQLLPVSVNQSVLRWELHELPALLALPDNVRQQVRSDAIAFSRKVLNEDKPIVEMCQQGLGAAGIEP